MIRSPSIQRFATEDMPWPNPAPQALSSPSTSRPFVHASYPPVEKAGDSLLAPNYRASDSLEVQTGAPSLDTIARPAQALQASCRSIHIHS